MESLYERCMKVMPPVVKRATTMGVTKGEGCYLWSEDGRKILDFASGVAVCNLGHNHPKVVEAAEKQMKELIHGGHNVVYYESYVRLAERLVELTGGDTMVYFSNSGAEANEGAIKLAKYVTKRPGIIAFRGSFHGRTLATTSLTSSSSAYRKNYEGLLPSVYFAEYPYLYRTPYEMKDGKCPKEYFEQFENIFHTLIDPSMVAAIMMEPVQGEGGYIVPDKEFVQYVREICDKYGILLIFDEVQSGMGRTGKLFAYEHFGVKPDILTSAKGIANGFPLSAVIGKKEIMEQWPAGAHGGTFGGNPVACAAANAVLDELTDGGMLDNAAKMGDYFKEKLFALQKKYPSVIGDVRGLGLMLAMEMVHPDKTPDADITTAIRTKALEKGLLLLGCGTNHNIVRFIAPTIVTEKEIDIAINIIDECLKELTE
ncbi:MAG: aspartate aminotransferase family protein [Clostridia bacterium]|jgi:4-aminobutyrate aminotransferase|uniref:(S)-3-amino-2-methylpropionate transaminase n=1 Tax=Bacteroides pectinophilus CAG:437 TaxID=1263051 RepID=R7B0Q5_9FIRM|nr:aspartate aminotransferase family protein [Clostridia bacterium]MEE0057531.1 aspartate aminotransferase family protein [[Bacteroides] pectinophilus]CDD56002.1 acetylornithine aminotransferase 3 [Bacteroides pectinophilus CAG:437]